LTAYAISPTDFIFFRQTLFVMAGCFGLIAYRLSPTL
jgi:hypothetical protein